MKRILITGLILVVITLWLGEQKPVKAQTQQDARHYAAMTVCSNEVAHLKAQVAHDAIDEPVFGMNPTSPFGACPQGWNKKVLFFRYYSEDEAAAR
jgi:hypothetical protein